MNESKAHFWDALATPSGQQNKQDSVSESLATPNKFYRAADGSLTWSYDVNNTDKTASGIVPSEFPTYDPMGPADQARTYSSLSQQSFRTRILFSHRLLSTTRLLRFRHFFQVHAILAMQACIQIMSSSRPLLIRRSLPPLPWQARRALDL